MAGLPIVFQQATFKTTGFSNIFTADIPLPMQHIPSKYTLQVTGFNAAGTVVVAPTSWNVTLQGSLDMLGYDDDTGAVLTHVSGTNANGARVSTDAKQVALRAFRIHCQALNLNTADHILVSVLGTDG